MSVGLAELEDDADDWLAELLLGPPPGIGPPPSIGPPPANMPTPGMAPAASLVACVPLAFAELLDEAALPS